MRRWWKWVRLGWTGIFGYKTASGNRVRLYADVDGGVIIAAFRDEPSWNDRQELGKWLTASPFPEIRYRDMKTQRVYE
jgi:hypothetical protein